MTKPLPPVSVPEQPPVAPPASANVPLPYKDDYQAPIGSIYNPAILHPDTVLIPKNSVNANGLPVAQVKNITPTDSSALLARRTDARPGIVERATFDTRGLTLNQILADQAKLKAQGHKISGRAGSYTVEYKLSPAQRRELTAQKQVAADIQKQAKAMGTSLSVQSQVSKDFLDDQIKSAASRIAFYDQSRIPDKEKLLESSSGNSLTYETQPDSDVERGENGGDQTPLGPVAVTRSAGTAVTEPGADAAPGGLTAGQGIALAVLGYFLFGG